MSIARRFRGLSIALLSAAMLPVVALASGSTFQAVNMQVFGSGDLASGGATLTRHASGIHLRATGSVFTAYATYSAWFIIFNNPEQCAAGPGACSGADLGNPRVGGAVLNAGGFIADGSGNGYFAGTLSSGPAPGGMCCFGQLVNGNKAEVHILLLDHGLRNPGEIAAHMSTPPGGVDQYFFIFAPAN